MKVHFILHETFEAPAAYLKWAQSRGHEISFTRVYEEDNLPQNADGFDFLIVMGGPQSPNEDKEQFPYYNPQDEMALIQEAIAADKYIVGVCLGAQLLSVAYGATYDHSPEREIGVFPIRLTDEGMADPHLHHFGEVLEVGHWHGDMPGLTEQSQVLASSQGCTRQIVRFSPKHYAFQAHLEFDPETIELLIEADGQESLAEQAKNLPYVEAPSQLRSHDYREMNQKLFQFLDSLVGQENE